MRMPEFIRQNNHRDTEREMLSGFKSGHSRGARQREHERDRQ